MLHICIFYIIIKFKQISAKLSEVKMNRKDLLKTIGYKLSKIREGLRYSGPTMASYFGTKRSTYLRNEKGETCPDIWTMRLLGDKFNVSLDWLICDKGPMYYRDKEQKQADAVSEAEKPAAAAELQESAPEDVRELLEHIKRIPLLRHEIMVSFYKFKEEYKDMVAAAMA